MGSGETSGAVLALSSTMGPLPALAVRAYTAPRAAVVEVAPT